MTSCDVSDDTNIAAVKPVAGIPLLDEMISVSRDLGGGLMQSDVVVDDVHCGGCIRTIERDCLRWMQLRAFGLIYPPVG